jgi:AcrR family transcriptional regulator
LTVTTSNVTVGNMMVEGRRDHRAERRAQRVARREVLLDAAVAAIQRHGPGASMEQIAAEAGVTKPILYRHFEDRTGLVRAIADRFSRGLYDELQSALRAPAADPRAVLERTVDAFVSVIEREPNVYRFLLQGSGRRAPDALATLSEFLRQVGNDVALVLGEQFRALGRDSGGAEPLAHGVVGFVYAAGDWWIERRTMPRERLVRYVADMLWSGFAGVGIAPENEEVS